MIIKDLGAVSAYAYAVEKGYTGTEEEFAELMASYATVAEEAAESAESAQASATTASSAASTATTKASEATTAAQTATAKAEEAQADADAAALDASQALSAASTATTKASEAAQSASDATTAKTAAQTAQTAAEGSATTAQTAAQTATQKAAEAAESARTLTIDPTLTQSGQAADAKKTGDEFSAIKEDLTHIYTEQFVHLVSENAYVYNGADTPVVSLVYSGYGFTATLSPSANCQYGFSFPTEIGKHYDVDIVVASGPIANVSAVKGTSFSITTYLDRIADVSSGKITLSFVAQTTTTTIWFNHRYNVPYITVTDVSIVEGWEYNNLDTTLKSERFPAQGKAVGDKLADVPPASWIGYNNLFNIQSTDLVTDVGTVTRTISGNSITLANSSGTNALTSYKFTRLEVGKYYTLDFDCNADLTISNQTARLTTGATASSIGNTYAELTKNDNHYSCEFKALYYTVYLALPQKYKTTMVLSNIFIRKSHVTPDNTYCDYNGTEITMFHRCLCIGDSLTYGGFNADDVDPDVGIDSLANKYSYPTYLQKITGIEVVKSASGGITSVDWWNAHKNDDLSGYDMAIIQLGVNDGSPSHYGGWTQDSIDAFTNIIGKLQTDNKGIKVFVATTINAPAYMDRYRAAVSAGIRELVADLDDDDVVLVDIHNYGHLNESIGYNAGHLTAYGYNRLARDYIAIISYLMSQHMELYRFIQFIGTDYSYSG